MADLRQQLRKALRGRVCVMGIGAASRGDDAFGPCLAQRLQQAGHPDVLLAGNTPEHFLVGPRLGHFDHVLLLDAVEIGQDPGAVVFLNRGELVSTFPQISTHKLSLGLLARVLEDEDGPRVWLLGVQPQSLRPGKALSSCVQISMEILAEELADVLNLPIPESAPEERARS